VKVSEIGEFGLIRLLAAEFGLEYPPARDSRPRPGLLVDIGDDAVVGRRRDGAAVWTTDTLVAGVHFLPERTAWTATGWKALAVNVSDVAAMGATPDLALVTLGLPGQFLVENAIELYRGLREAAKAFGVTLAGGDIVRSPVFFATVALSGWARLTELGQPLAMTRGAARPGDIVAVSGWLGESGAGLKLLLDGAEARTAAQKRLIGRHERPQPRLALGREAIAHGVRCAIDVSDGLVQDLGHVARASGVIIRLDAPRLPLSASLKQAFPRQAQSLALSGGEDYELALVAPPPVIERLLRDGDVPVTAIGEVLADDGQAVRVVDESGREVAVGPGGWDHFRSS